MYSAIVFFDLDGTLLNSNQQIQASSLRAIQQLRANHVLPVIATGRNILMVKSILEETGIDTAISANGSYLLYHNRSLNVREIPRSILQKLVRIANQRHVPLAFQDKGQIVLTAESPLTDAAYAKHQLNPKVNAKFYQNHPVNFVNLFTADPNQDHFYQRCFSNQLTIVRNSHSCLDVTGSGINKQSGIKALLESLKLNNVPTYAFGDGLNDLQMFNEVDHAIAMGNGQSKCRSAADFVTADNNHDGIDLGLKHYHLIK